MYYNISTIPLYTSYAAGISGYLVLLVAWGTQASAATIGHLRRRLNATMMSWYRVYIILVFMAVALTRRVDHMIVGLVTPSVDYPYLKILKN